MRERLLFLSKLVGASVILFAFWRPLSKIYIFVLSKAFAYVYLLFYSGDTPRLIEESLYKFSMSLIPFVSLVLATPNIKALRRTGMIAAGLVMFLLFDLTALVLLAAFFTLPEGQPAESAIHPLGSTDLFNYVCRGIVLLLSMSLWLVLTQEQVRELLLPKQTPSRPLGLCPICGKESIAVTDHIRALHGGSVLKMRKVRRYLGKNNERREIS